MKAAQTLGHLVAIVESVCGSTCAETAISTPRSVWDGIEILTRQQSPRLQAIQTLLASGSLPSRPLVGEERREFAEGLHIGRHAEDALRTIHTFWFG